MKNKRQKGFTLIELLVVIAIIGLLATIALASLNSARTKSADASVKSNMANINAQGEIYYDGVGNGSYGDIASCETGVFADTGVAAMITQALSSAATTATATCTSDQAISSQNWAITIGPLRSGADSYWCVDNSGNRKPEAVAGGSANGVCL